MVKRVVIAGGGTAGWMAAAAISKLIGKHLDVRLVESDAIGTVGVGEATIPTLHVFHQLLGLKESEVMAATNATFKLGINFENWHDVGKDYLHSFGYPGKDCWAAGFQHFWRRGLDLGIDHEIGDYCFEHLAAREHRFAVLPNRDRNHAYHLDATLYAKFLRRFAERHGVRRVEGKIENVELDSQSGDITALALEGGERIEGDLFIDCTGFRALLIENALHTGYLDWTHWLPCDRALAVQTTSEGAPLPYTRSIAHESGWQWRIPLQNRVGNGLVYCSRYLDDDAAKQLLLENISGETLTEPRLIKFRTGTRRKHWNKNCVAIGLSSGFIEPLESTSIHMIQRSIIRLLQLFPSSGFNEADIEEFNRQTAAEIETIRDFIVLHYHVTDRQDSKFWRYCRDMPIPASLQHRLDLFEQRGHVFKQAGELFGESSWIQVIVGQGIIPKEYHPIVDMMSDDELKDFLDTIRNQIRHQVAKLPKHEDFVEHYCKASAT